MAAYVIGMVTVHDPSWIEEYGPKVEAIVEAHGGKYIARSTEPEKLEGGTPLPTATVVLEFPTIEQARSWYNSAEYQPWIKLRQAGSTGDLILVDGL